MRSTKALALFGIAAAALLFSYTESFAYQFWSDDVDDVGQCAACHGAFRSGTYFSVGENISWGDHLHAVHLDNTDVESSPNGACDSCHDGAGTSGRKVNLQSSVNANDGVNAIACMGCHGRLEDEAANIGAGLRAHHMGADAYLNWPGGIPGFVTCAQCHPGDPTPVGESTAPPWYASITNTSIMMTMNPCGLDGEEDFSSNGEGLDNDGDGDYDSADSDCGPAAEPFYKVIALPDVNLNGNTDLAVIRTGSVVAEIRDGQAGALLNTLYFFGAGFTPVTGAALSDADGNGVSELAVLATRDSDSRMVVEIRNVSGAAAPRQIWFLANHSPVDMAVIEADADGNTIPELAVLSARDSDGRNAVEIKNAFGATNPNTVWPGPGLLASDPGAYTASDIEVLPDADSNGVPEVAVLLTRDSDSRIVVDIKNAAGAINPHAVWFMAGNTAIDLAVVPDKDANSIPEVAVLSSRNSDSRNVVEIKNAAGATSPSTVWFAAGHTASQVESVNDADANSTSEVAVLSTRDSDSRTLVEVKNVTGATNTNSIWYSSGFTAQGMAILNDTDNNTIEEVAVLMIRDSDSRILVQGRNAAGNPAPIDYWFSP